MPTPLPVNNRRLVLVANRLPLSITRKGGKLRITPGDDGLATLFFPDNNWLWVGWPGLSPGNNREKLMIEETLQRDFNCYPVYLTASDLKKYYYGFSNKTLRPLFHYFPTHCTYNPAEWESYQKVNQLFCGRLRDVLRPGDMVWIHDYHLLLLPALLREERPETAVGLFLHIPFPSMEIFRLLPWRENILRGMLGADLIGFHTSDYSRHFLSCARRILGIEHENGQAAYGGRRVKVAAFPMGIDAEKYSAAVTARTVENRKELLRKKIKTGKIVLSVDRLDFTTGIPERLKAFALFLENNPEWHKRLTLIMLCIPSRTKVRQYQLLKDEIEELVAKINNRFATPEWLPVHYLYRTPPFEELVALYGIADLALVTPLRDGTNPVAKEYLACQSRDGKGVLILSETAGSAPELPQALIVNPHDLEMVAGAIAKGLTLSDEEKRANIDCMAERIKKHNIFRWAEDFIQHLAAVKEDEKQNQPSGGRQQKITGGTG